MMTLDSG